MSKVGASWPMANYIAAWKTFRRVGNEPTATAAHILGQPLWPKKEPLMILDVGCGDGRMLEALLLKVPQEVSQVILLDPEDWMLADAKNEVDALGLGIEVTLAAGVADIEGIALAEQVDVGLGIHLAYLLSHARFCNFIDRWPAGVPLYVILDAPNSVFSKLWAKTAPEYATRSARVHTYLSGKADHQYAVRNTEFATRVANPYALSQSVCDLVLSLLCYCDYTSLAQILRQEVEGVLGKYIDGEEIKCTCSCYEILK